MAHNYYQNTGGEDISYSSESALLQKMGNEVQTYQRHNREILDYSIFKKLRLLGEPAWSQKTYAEVREVLASEKFDLVHVQNFFPLISPSIFYACKSAGVPVVFSVRNYRLFCLNGLFTRQQRPCEVCMKKGFAYPGIFYRCYRNSYVQSAAVAHMQRYHRLRKTWDATVDRYIALSEFERQKMSEGGIDPGKIAVKPNFVEDPGEAPGEGDYAIYVGRISGEKGIATLLEAWEGLPDIPLRIVGDGPLLHDLMARANAHPNIGLLGQRTHRETLDLIKGARFLVFPTEWYETFGRVVIEAYACGKPVICSDIGAVRELIADQKTGLLFKACDPLDLREKARWMWTHSTEYHLMEKQARKEYEEKYTPERNYQMLMEIYRQVLNRE